MLAANLEVIKQFISSKQYKNAIDTCRSTLQITPETQASPLYSLLAIAYFNTKQYQACIDAIFKVEKWVDSPSLLSMSASCYMQLGQYSAAIARFRLLAGWEHQEVILLQVATAYAKQNLFEQACEIFDKIQSYGSNASAVITYTEMLVEHGKPKKALEVFERFKGGPNSYRVQFLHANCLERFGDVTKARDIYELLYKAEPTKKVAMQLIPYRMAAQDYRGAIDMLFHRRVKNMRGKTHLKAKCYNSLGQYDKTIAMLERGRVHNYSSDIKLEFALAYIGKGRAAKEQVQREQAFDRAHALLEQLAQDEDPKIKAGVLKCRGDFQNALALFKTIPNHQTNPDIILEMIDCYENLYDFQSLIALVEPHIDWLWHDLRIASPYGLALSAVGEFEKAREIVDKSLNDGLSVEMILESVKLDIYQGLRTDFNEVAKQLAKLPDFRDQQGYVKQLKVLRSFADFTGLFRIPDFLPKVRMKQVHLPDDLKHILQTHDEHSGRAYLSGSVLFDLINGHDIEYDRAMDVICFADCHHEFQSQRNPGHHIILPGEYADWYKAYLGPFDNPLPDAVNQDPAQIQFKLVHDFTMSGLCCNMEGTVIDLTGLGLNDLEQKRIRTAVNPRISLEQDNLRVLRAIKYACQGYEIADDLADAIKQWVPNPGEAWVLYHRLQYDLTTLDFVEQQMYFQKCLELGVSEKLSLLFITNGWQVPYEFQVEAQHFENPAWTPTFKPSYDHIKPWDDAPVQQDLDELGNSVQKLRLKDYAS